MNAYRDYDGTWVVADYKQLGSFSTEADAKTAIQLARAVSSVDQVAEYFNRRAAARGQQRVAEVLTNG